MMSLRPFRRSAPDTPVTRAYVDAQIDALRQEMLERLAGGRFEPRSPRTMSTGEAAQILGVGKPHVARLAAAERLGKKVGPRWRLDRHKVLALKARREP